MNVNKRKNAIIWTALTVMIFAFFRWLFGIAIPEIALEFALGTTFILVSGLMTGRAVTLLVIRTKGISDWARSFTLLMIFVVVGIVAIAFLLNAMIEETTFFPFAITILLLFLVNAAFGSLVTIIRHQYKSRITSAQAAMAQSRSELQLLQSQISPHFLFNTLNNLYGLSLTEPQRVPPLLLKLSELLRYSVYEVKEIFVPLQYEVDYIRNYVVFECLRLGERLKLTMDIDPAFDDEYKIPPMLLLVFVENAFKHSRSTGDQAIKIDISLHTKAGRIVFLARNSQGMKPTAGEHPEKHSGFGLDSVRKRLSLLYGGKHALRIDSTVAEYVVQLELDCR